MIPIKEYSGDTTPDMYYNLTSIIKRNIGYINLYVSVNGIISNSTPNKILGKVLAQTAFINSRKKEYKVILSMLTLRYGAVVHKVRGYPFRTYGKLCIRIRNVSFSENFVHVLTCKSCKDKTF